MDRFFNLISPNPEATFAFANLVLFTLASLVPEPNHLGRLLHPQRHFNGTGWLHRLHYALWMPSACVTSSIIAAFHHPPDKRFWIEVLRYVDPPFGKRGMQSPTSVYCLSLKPTQHDDTTPTFSEENSHNETIKMLIFSEAQALFLFLITTTLHESYLTLLFLAPLAIKLLALIAGPHRHGLYHTGSSVDAKSEEHVFTRRTTVPGLGIVVIRGHEFYVRQFGRLGSYGQAMEISNGRNISDIARQIAEKLAIFLSLACYGFSIGLCLRYADWKRQDVVPWLWLLQQTVAVFAWTVSRLAGFADVGRTEDLLGEALSERGYAVLAGKKSYLGVKAILDATVVDGREEVEKMITEFEQNSGKSRDVECEKSEVLPEKEQSAATLEAGKLESQSIKVIDRSESSVNSIFDRPGEDSTIALGVLLPKQPQTEEAGSYFPPLIQAKVIAPKEEELGSTPRVSPKNSTTEVDGASSSRNRPASPQFISLAGDSGLGAGL